MISAQLEEEMLIWTGIHCNSKLRPHMYAIQSKLSLTFRAFKNCSMKMKCQHSLHPSMELDQFS